MILFLSIFLIAMIVQGWILIFNKDMIWRWEETSMRKKGAINPERTPQWDILTTVGGVIIVVIAATMLLMVITQN
jgi:hypothetical protein